MNVLAFCKNRLSLEMRDLSVFMREILINLPKECNVNVAPV
jgi:hypothetical protein